uniref:Glutathione peroxidase n=1 Tax=Strigamia maritima TaxID=126957 RepID=T1INU7_STRMM
MRTLLSLLLLLSFLLFSHALGGYQLCGPYAKNESTSVYDFVIPDLFEKMRISLRFTDQYAELNDLQSKFKQLSILAFPCNQFGMQEPGFDGVEIYNGIKHVRPGNGFEPAFQLFVKIDVNGEHEHPLYTFLKVSFCPPVDSIFAEKERLFYKPLRDNDVRWNFEKFLISKTGKVLVRYAARVPISEIEPDVLRVLDDQDLKKKRKNNKRN